MAFLEKTALARPRPTASATAFSSPDPPMGRQQQVGRGRVDRGPSALRHLPQRRTPRLWAKCQIAIIEIDAEGPHALAPLLAARDYSPSESG
jgi:hypothetical protein